jgi:hypothetical protein
MKSFALLTAALALGLTLATGDADAAKRFGGGKSSGMQRQELSQPKSATATPATPAQAPTAAAAPNRAQQAGAPAAPQAQPKRSWMGPLAGLAAGIGLAALASHFGFGEELASMMMMGLIAVAVMMLIGFFMRRRAASQQPAMAGAGAGAGAMNYTSSNPPNIAAARLSLLTQPPPALRAPPWTRSRRGRFRPTSTRSLRSQRQGQLHPPAGRQRRPQPRGHP